jgi:antitoxin (DNA-binding transcriptional repressor) of toxin-antitoxin stability system
MTARLEITQHDLRNRSREIMDAVGNGQAFTVIRDGRRIAELIPLRGRRRFIPRREFVATSLSAPALDIDAFRTDQDSALDHDQASGPRDHGHRDDGGPPAVHD